MDAQLIVDRRRLRDLLALRPEWKLQDFADALGRSLSWVKKWAKRLRQAASDDDNMLEGHSCARHTPPPTLSQLVIERILDIRDHPPHNLHRTPGPKAILYYLEQEASTTLQGQRLPRSTRTIWRILHQYQRISSRRSVPIRVWNVQSRCRVGNSTLRTHRPFHLTQMANNST
jgi:hypothetical protein